MKRKWTILTIALLLCASSSHAEWKQGSNTNAIPLLFGTNDFSGILSVPNDKLKPEQSDVVKVVTSGKVPTRDAAWKVLAERSESVKWMASDLSRMLDRGLRKLNRDVEGFGKKGDFVWLIEVDMAHLFHGVFLVNSQNGELMGLP